jgi:hypothetical protein
VFTARGFLFVYTSIMLKAEEKEIEITSDQIKEWHPFFALPCYDMQMTEPFFMSFVKTAMGFKDIGLKFSVSTLSDSLISRARNQLVAKFMANPEFTHLIFIDVDLGFNPDDILKMLWHDKEIVTGAYPIKDINWDKVSRAANKGVKPENLLDHSTRFVVNPVRFSDDKITLDKGAISVHDAGTGFMLIKRSAFEKMFEHYPELKYSDDTGLLNEEERKHSYALFNSYVDEDERFLSEDYGFCRYWQKMGGEIWTDPTIELSHLGRMKYKGTLMQFLIDNTVPATE